MELLEVSGLCKSYGSFALQDISFVLPTGYIMGYIGRNGAGKSTTLNAITRLISPDAGIENREGRFIKGMAVLIHNAVLRLCGIDGGPRPPVARDNQRILLSVCVHRSDGDALQAGASGVIGSFSGLSGLGGLAVLGVCLLAFAALSCIAGRISVARGQS